MFGLGKEKITVSEFTQFLMDSIFNAETIKFEVNEFIDMAKDYSFELDNGYDSIKKHWVALKAVLVFTLITDDDVSIRISLKTSLIPKIEDRFKVKFNHLLDLQTAKESECTPFNWYDGYYKFGQSYLDWTQFICYLKDYIPTKQIKAFEEDMRKEAENLKSGILNTTDNSGSKLVFLFKQFRSHCGKSLRSIKEKKKIVLN
tara:strand:+ start:465 stop:1070 length:606 start_codon:yes stop_codon:yes gene_type:complete